MEGREEGPREGEAKAPSSYRVEIQPFYTDLKIGVPGFKKRKVEAGYIYRLFVNNLPCLEATKSVPQSTTEYELDLEALTKQALRVAQSLAMPDGVGIAVTVLDVLKTNALDKRLPEAMKESLGEQIDAAPRNPHGLQQS